MPRGRPLGRPIKAPEDLRDRRIMIRLTEEEYEAISAAARDAGLEVATWARVEIAKLVKARR